MKNYLPFSASLLLTLGLAAADQQVEAELQQLQAQTPGLHAQTDPTFGTASSLNAGAGFLVPAPPVGLRAGLRAEAPVMAFLDSHPALCGGDSSLLQGAEQTCNSVDAHNGLHSLIWQQKISGIPVYRARIVSHVTSQGALVDLGNRFVPAKTVIQTSDANATALAAVNRDARSALASALIGLGAPSGSTPVTCISPAQGSEAKQVLANDRLSRPAQANLVWYPLDSANLRLSWRVSLSNRQDGKMYAVIVDALDGRIHERQCLTIDGCFSHHQAGKPAAAVANPMGPKAAAAATRAVSPKGNPGTEVTYQIFDESPTPMWPGWPTSQTTQPATVARTSATLSSLSATASPLGWMSGNETKGNNVDAFLDIDENGVPDSPRPAASGFPLVFSTTCNLALAPTTYVDAATVNAFYWINFYHDQLFGLGFDEASGNFQNTNFSGLGQGGDAVTTMVHAASAANNAMMSTDADGNASYMLLGIANWITPNRDSSFDASVILHECTHGLSGRLIGNGNGLTKMQSRGLGEGWSDFYSLCLLSKPTDDIYACYQTGAYLSGGLVSDNYYRGIRRYPYVHETGPITASSKNPLTFADIITNSEYHDAGEVWCATLWDARANLIAKHGATAGNQLILQLVTDGMKLLGTNTDPDFLDARDAILRADAVLGGANQAELWAAFARRGLGANALTKDSSTTQGVVEAYDLPGNLRVAPHTALVATGITGGPFVPSQLFHTLSNAGASPLNWTAQADQTWITISPAAGTLAAGASVQVLISINSLAVDLSPSMRYASVTFSDTTNAYSLARTVTFLIEDNYQSAIEPASWIDPSTHTNLFLGNDAVAADKPLPFPFTYYGQSYTTISIGSNGLAGFQDASKIASPASINIPSTETPNAAISALVNDLDPSAGGSVRLGTIGTSPNQQVVISWVGVPYYGQPTSSNSVQIVLSEGKRDILVNYKMISAPGGSPSVLGIEDSYGLMACKPAGSPSGGQALRYSMKTRPTVANAATATPAIVSAKTSSLSVLGADDAGEPSLTYSWKMISGPTGGSVTWSPNSTNAARTTTATFTRAGSYLLRCAISNSKGLFVTTDTTVTVLQTPTSLTVYPNPGRVNPSTAMPFYGSIIDQFGENVSGSASSFTWSISSANSGSIDSATGVFTANNQLGGPYLVVAAGSGLVGSALVTVTTTSTAPSHTSGSNDGGGSSGGCGAGAAGLLLLGLIGLRRRR